MKIEVNNLKTIKRVDDTVPKSKVKKQKTVKPTQNPKVKKQSKKVLKMLPGQQILSFKPKLMKIQEQKLQFICIDERTMGWPESFSDKLISHDYDNDQESNENVVNREVQKGIASLVEEITFKKIMEMEDTIGF